jgi:hypothetical protein
MRKERILISVDCATVKENRSRAVRPAQLKATRNVFGHIRSIQFTSMEILTDQEDLHLSEIGETGLPVSDLFSIQEEKISGLTQVLPVVATWEGSHNTIWVAIGAVFRKNQPDEF